MNNQEINTKDLLGIGLIFKNDESMSIPTKYLDVHKLQEHNLDITIKYGEDIKYKGVYKNLTCLQRIDKYDDIVAIDLIYNSKTIEYRPLWWKNPNPYKEEYENKYQTSEISDHANSIHIKINKDVLKRRIEDMRFEANSLLQQAEELELSIA